MICVTRHPTVPERAQFFFVVEHRFLAKKVHPARKLMVIRQVRAFAVA